MRAYPFDMTGRTVIVTGGTAGLGRAMAETFLDHGADVVICARRPPDGPVTGSDGADRAAHFVAADVRDPEQVAAVVAAATEATGRIDVLVNNAGGAPPADSAAVSPRFNEKVVALNLLAPLAFAQAVYPVMAAQDGGGVIVNISSLSGTRPNPTGAAYGAAKAGLDNLTQTLACEWGPAIRVVGVTVGFVLTEQAPLYYGDSAGIEAVGRTVAMGRMADPAEVADAVLFLASPLASYITGANVAVHGGGEKPAYLAASTGAVAGIARRHEPGEPQTGER